MKSWQDAKQVHVTEGCKYGRYGCYRMSIPVLLDVCAVHADTE